MGLGSFLDADFGGSQVSATTAGCAGPCDCCDYPETEPPTLRRRVLRAALSATALLGALVLVFVIAAFVVDR